MATCVANEKQWISERSSGWRRLFEDAGLKSSVLLGPFGVSGRAMLSVGQFARLAEHRRAPDVTPGRLI